MNKAVFLDRDGVLNREQGAYITSVNEFEVLPGVKEALRTLKDKGYLLIIITNQGGIAKGLYTHAGLADIHNKLVQEVSHDGVFFSEIYYCPHHPDFDGKCLCRKPGSLMVEKAMARFKIDPAASWFIGDHERDMGAAEAAGVKGIRVVSNQDLRETISIIP